MITLHPHRINLPALVAQWPSGLTTHEAIKRVQDACGFPEVEKVNGILMGSPWQPTPANCHSVSEILDCMIFCGFREVRKARRVRWDANNQHIMVSEWHR